MVRRSFLASLVPTSLAVARGPEASRSGEWVLASRCVDPRPYVVEAHGRRYSADDIAGIRDNIERMRRNGASAEILAVVEDAFGPVVMAEVRRLSVVAPD
jgi:hypothetical protein